MDCARRSTRAARWFIPCYDLGEEFSGDLHAPRLDYKFEEMTALFGDLLDVKPEGYAVDKKFPDIVYVPEDVHFDLLQVRR